MSRGENQKLKLAYLTRIMLEKTDEDHALTLAQIIAELEARGVTAERKSLYTAYCEANRPGLRSKMAAFRF